MMNKFDMQIQCEEFYREELQEREQAVVTSCVSRTEETMGLIAKYQMLFDDAESYLRNEVDCDDFFEHTRVTTILIGYQEILDDLKSFSWVAEYFIDEPAKRRYYDCNNCPFTKGEEDINSCTCGCALFTEDDILLHD